MSDDKNVPQPDVNVGDGAQVPVTPEEILQDKMENEDILRSGAKEDASNPNDAPGFEDGVQGGWDGDTRLADPGNSADEGTARGESDAEGEVKAGAGAPVSGGIDGGPTS